MKDSRDIKRLKTKLRTLQDEEHVLEMEAKDANRKWNIKQNEIRELKTQIKKLEGGVSANVQLTEHAICRYLERVKGLTPDDIIDELLTEDVVRMIETLGPNGKYPIKGGYRLVLKNNRIVTIEPPQ
jgi:predicted  nucleic acid-binding Zn-ribbon protein